MSDPEWPQNARGRTFPQELAKFIASEVLREQNTGKGVHITPEQLAAIVHAKWRGEISHAEARHFFKQACEEARLQKKSALGTPLGGAP